MNDRGGVVVNWDLKTTLEGLYAAGEQMFAPAAHGYAAATGRYAGRKAAAYVSQRTGRPFQGSRSCARKPRYAPTKRKEGIEWKELHAGMARMMQYFCSEYKTEKLLIMGWMRSTKSKDFAPKLYASIRTNCCAAWRPEHSSVLSTYRPRFPGAQGKQPAFEFPKNRLSADGSARMEEVHHA